MKHTIYGGPEIAAVWPPDLWTSSRLAKASIGIEPGAERVPLGSVSPFDYTDIKLGALPPAFVESCLGQYPDLWVTPFQWTSWLQSWHQHIGMAAKSVPVTVIAYSNGVPVMILPLAVSSRYGYGCLTWQAYSLSDYGAPIVHQSFLERLRGFDGADFLQRIAGRLGGIDLIYLQKQLTHIGGIANPFVLQEAFAHHAGAHAINFAAGESWESFLLQRRSSKTRRRLKEKRNALERLGAVKFRLADNPGDAASAIETCLGFKSEQLEKLGHWDPFSAASTRGFLLDYFSRDVGQKTWVAILDLDSRPIAVAFGFAGRKEWLLYQMAMCGGGPEAQCSPGTHLLMNLMQHCIAAGLTRLDLALGDEAYKSDWCDEHMALKTATIAVTWRGVLCGELIALRAALQARLASDPRLYNAGKWLKRVLKRVGISV